MFISKALNTNDKGHLTIGGADTIALAEEFGTPLYIMDEDLITENMRAYTETLDKYYNGKGMILYASKAFCTKEMCRIADREGFGLDVVSGGEMYTAISAGVSPSKLCLHGNNKDLTEIETAIEKGIGRIVADSIFELSIINEIAAKMNKVQKVLVRIKPGIEAHTHEFIQTGQNDSKFGVSLEGGEALEVFKNVSHYKNLDFAGVHCHIGSQIFDTNPFKTAARLMIKFMADVKKETGIALYELNLGGGFGIKYTSDDNPKPYSEYMQESINAVLEASKEFNYEPPFILMEPGRSIVGAAGITLYRTGAIKDIKGIRKYVAVNGGMADNPRYIMYESRYDALLAERPLAEKTEMVTICGKCCESGDLLIKDIMMPEIKSGELLAVLSTGAYNYSMSSNYNRIPRPAVVMVKGGIPRVIVKRETFDDLSKNDI